MKCMISNFRRNHVRFDILSAIVDYHSAYFLSAIVHDLSAIVCVHSPIVHTNYAIVRIQSANFLSAIVHSAIAILHSLSAIVRSRSADFLSAIVHSAVVCSRSSTCRSLSAIAYDQSCICR